MQMQTTATDALLEWASGGYGKRSKSEQKAFSKFLEERVGKETLTVHLLEKLIEKWDDEDFKRDQYFDPINVDSLIDYGV